MCQLDQVNVDAKWTTKIFMLKNTWKHGLLFAWCHLDQFHPAPYIAIASSDIYYNVVGFNNNDKKGPAICKPI